MKDVSLAQRLLALSATELSTTLRQSPYRALLILVAVAFASRLIYNVYFHPLSKFPGPWYYAASDIPYAISQLRGTSQYSLADLHACYGDILRIGPSALTFTDARAWEGLYGLRKGGVAALPKDPLFYSEMLLDSKTITRMSDVDAIPVRRSMNAAFAPKHLLALESMLRSHIERLVAELAAKSNASEDHRVDVRKWFTMLMFDINSDFGFGEDMNCVRNGEYHEWVQFVVDFFYAATVIHQCHKFWPLAPLLAKFMPRPVQEAKEKHGEGSLARVRRRMRQTLERPDFMHHFAKQAEREGLPKDVIEAQASVVILAGSETSSVALVAATYYALSNPTIYRKLCGEIRSLFRTKTDISLSDTLSRLPYLHAVVWESLRIHAPLANGFTRVVPALRDDFVVYDQQHIPPSTVVHINHYAINTSARNFRDPLRFVPERWLGNKRYDTDQRNAVQPFSVGPRNCPGRQFALNNIKLAMVYMIVEFDMELCDSMQSWDVGQRIYNGWQQRPLYVRLRRRATIGVPQQPSKVAT